MLEEGATPYQVDRVTEDFGMPMGSFKVSDLSGTEISKLLVKGFKALVVLELMT